MTPQQKMGLKIRKLRRALDVTQADFGIRIGVGKTMVCEIEKGKKSPSLWVAKSIAKELKTTIDKLF